jgi:hypothetical protein
MNTISSVNNTTTYTQQNTNKVAEVNSTNLANNAANQSAFSSYISQALAQVRVINPTNLSAPVVSGADKISTANQKEQKTISTFIQDLFSALSKEEIQKNPVLIAQQGIFQKKSQKADNSEDDFNNTVALAAYDSENSTTVGHLVANLQKLIADLNSNTSENENKSKELQSLQVSFQNILIAQGATTSQPESLKTFLQTLAQNLQGQSPLGIIINMFS